MSKLLHLIAVAAISLTINETAQAAAFSRGLPNSQNGPTTYVNNAAGANRANVNWGLPFGEGYMLGDDFSFGSNTLVDSLTIWAVSNNTVASGNNTTPQAEFSQIDLWLGLATGPLSLASSTYTSQLVTYQPGGQNYEGPSGSQYHIYALTFSGLNFNATANTLYGFAVNGTPIDRSHFLFLHASNAALSIASGVTQDGADNLFRYYLTDGTFDPPLCDSGDQSCGGWDKSSDINVMLTAVPEPSTFALIGLGAGILLLRRRRRVS